MKAVCFNCPSNENGQKFVYDLKTNSVNEEHKISILTKCSDKVVSLQKDSLPEVKNVNPIVKKESSFVNFDWEDKVDKESVSFSLESTVKKDPEL